MFLTRREPGVPLSLFRPYPLPFSPLFLLLFLTLPFLMSFSLIYICCSFRGGILSVVPLCNQMFLTRREPGVPLSLFRPYPLPFSPLFLLLFLTLPFLLFFFHWSISAVVSGEAFYLQNSFFHSSTTPVMGGTLRWAWKTHFLIQYKKKLIISGDLFFVETF